MFSIYSSDGATVNKMAEHVDDIVFKQKAVIEFLSKEGINAKSISDRLKAVYGEHTLSYSSVRRWVQYFGTGATHLNDKHRSGRPSSAATEKNKIRVDEMIQKDRRVTVLDIMNELEIGSSAVQRIINDLGYRKVCARWVPRQLTDELKRRRLDICKELLVRYQSEGDTFMTSIVTGDETWVHHHEPETKRQSMQWRHLGSPSPKKFKLAPSAGKLMMTIFWDVDGVILTDFLPKGETINSIQYQETLKKLAAAIHRKRPGSRSTILHHDNARPHTAHATVAAVEAKGWAILPHPPYSPDLAPSDFHLFGPLKDYLRGQKFEDDEAIKAAVRLWIRQCDADFFKNGFVSWKTRWDKCVACNGDYIEK
jgi:histone-lysine N-methyltransferase SETMAR